MISKKDIKTIKDLSASWARAGIAAALAYYLATGDMSLKALASAALAAVIPPIIRFVNPKDPLGQ
jgi:hypothetical protein